MNHFYILTDNNGFCQQVNSLEELFQAFKSAKALGLSEVHLTHNVENRERLGVNSSVVIILNHKETEY